MARNAKKSKAKKAAAPRVAKKKKFASKVKSAVKKKPAKKRSGRKASLERAAARPEEIASALAAAAAADVVEADAAGLADEVAIPPGSTFNEGLQSAPEATMLSLLGVPGNKTQNCSSPTGRFAKRIKFNVNVGPFRVSGLDIAVAALKAVFDEALITMPDVVAAVKSEGMLCVRHKRNNVNSFSNHSWGAAIDLFFGTDVVPQGKAKTHRGVLMLAPIFNRHGWYWGAGFSGRSVDSMHFELAEDTIRASENAHS